MYQYDPHAWLTALTVALALAPLLVAAFCAVAAIRRDPSPVRRNHQ